MKIISINNVPEFSLPLPIYHSAHLADAIGKDGEEFSVFIGMEKKYAEQLRQLSLDADDEQLQNNTGDKKRFGEGSYKDWYGKNRTPFCLIHKQSDALVAIIWLGPKPLFSNETNWHSVGWRSYNPFRGKGLMRNFAKFAMDIYIKNFPDIKFWITTRRENIGSAKLATSLDFQILEEASNNASLVMVK
jgi:hypothetical protein